MNEAKQYWQSLVTEINQDFVIKYRYDGQKKWQLIGGGRYWLLLEKAKNVDEMVKRHFDRAIKTDGHTIINSLEGVTIKFFRK